MPLQMDTTLNRRRQELPVLLSWCLLLMVAWGLWLWRLDASDLTFDEAATYFVARWPAFDILDYLRVAVREHPPVYYLLIHGWMALAGTSEFSLRLFSVGTGLVVVGLTGWLARLAIGRSVGAAGLLPAALVAAVPGLAYYARDARMYTLAVVWMMLSAGLFVRDWLPARDWPPRVALVSLVIVHFVAIFTHYYLLLPILVQPLVLLVTRRWRPFLAWCAAHSLPALVGLGWLWLSPGLQMTTGGFWQHLNFVVPTSFQVFHLLGKILFSPVLQVRFRLLYALLALAGAGVALALWRRRPVGVWLVLVLLVPPAAAFLVPHPPAARYLLFLIPSLALALAFLGTAPFLLRKRWLGWSAAAGLTLGMVYMLASGGLYSAITFDRSDYSHALQTVKAYARPGDGVLFYGPWQWIPFEYYDPGDMPPITALPPYAPPRLKPAEAEPVLEQLLAQYDRLWVIPAAVDDVDPDRFVAGWLKTHTHAVWRTEGFSLYLSPLAADTSSQSVGMGFGDTLTLESVTWGPQAVPAGEPLRLALDWSCLGRPGNELRLTVELIEASGRVWAHTHTLLGQCEPGGLSTDYTGLLVPQGAPPGEYTVRLMVTDDVTDEPLLVEGEKWAVPLAIRVTEPIHAPVLYGLPNPGTAVFCAPDGAACLTLAGFEPGGLRFQQGHPVSVKLHWLTPGVPPPEVQLRLHVSHRSWLPAVQATPFVTRTVSLASMYSTDALALPSDTLTGSLEITLPVVAHGFPPSASDATGAGSIGRLLTVPAALELPPDAPTGSARVTLQVLGPDGVAWPMAEGGSTASIPLFDITVEGRPVLRRLPAGLTPVEVDFGAEMGLRGYRVEGTPEPGGQIHLTYAWYARTRPTAIYAVFNHLVSADGTLVAQADGWPLEGRMLTIQWQAGEFIEDTYTLAIPPDAPPGPYTLYVGLYDAAGGERQLAVQDGQRIPDDRLPIPLPGLEE
jgi:mannosyltransferase